MIKFFWQLTVLLGVIVLGLLTACGQQKLPEQLEPLVQKELTETEPSQPEESMVDYLPRTTLADTHYLSPNGYYPHEVRLAHVTVEKIWDAVFAAGPSRDAKQVYAVAV